MGSPVPVAPSRSALTVYQPDWCLLNGAVGDPGVGLWKANYPADPSVIGGLGPFTIVTGRRARVAAGHQHFCMDVEDLDRTWHPRRKQRG